MRPGPAAQAWGLTASGRRRRLVLALVPLLLVAYGYLAWPFLTLWRLDRALIRRDEIALAALVDLDAVRATMRRNLNKDNGGTPGPFSDDFIDWLQTAIRRGGTDALEQEVTLAWVRERLLSQSPPGAGLWPALSWAFFENPRQFLLRLGGVSPAPVVVRLRFTGIGWRVSGLSY